MQQLNSWSLEKFLLIKRLMLSHLNRILKTQRLQIYSSICMINKGLS